MIATRARRSASEPAPAGPARGEGRTAPPAPGGLWSALALRIDPADSPLEREADAIAIFDDEETHVAAPGVSSPDTAHDFDTRSAFSAARMAGGAALDPALRHDAERRFGQSFADVRVHTDPASAATAQGLHAAAFTVGHDIAFAPQRYRPGSMAGKHLIAHELAHVAQQRRGGAVPTRAPSSAAHEKEAAQLSTAFVGGAAFLPVRAGTPVGIACEGETPMSAAHAGGAMGERDAAFGLGRRGFDIVIGPAGPGGHQLTEPGLDIVAFNPATEELWIVDNKASGGTSTVQEASAITKNLEKNLKTALAEVKALPEFPNKSKVVALLDQAVTAVSGGKPLPAKVRLVVTPSGGYHSGVSKKLVSAGVGFDDLVGSDIRETRKADIKKAQASGQKPGRPVTRPATSEPQPKARVVETEAELHMAPTKAITSEAAMAAEEMGPIRRLMGGFAKGVEVFFSPKVQVPLTVALELLTAVEAMDMATGALSGEGFVFREQLKQARSIEKDADFAAADFEAGYHEELSRASTMAFLLITMKHSQQARTEMAAQAAELLPVMAERIAETQQFLDKVTEIEKDVNDRITLATKLLESKEFYALMGMTLSSFPAAQLVGAREDLYHIRGSMGRAKTSLTKLVGLLREDADVLRGYQ